jgi:hypothetical protein
MPEVQLVILAVDMTQLNLIQNLFDKHMWQVTDGDPQLALLVNGQTFPQLDMLHGKWYRYRMLFSSIDTAVVLRAVSTDGDAQCEVPSLWIDTCVCV